MPAWAAVLPAEAEARRARPAAEPHEPEVGAADGVPAVGRHEQQEVAAVASTEPVGPRAEHWASAPAVAASMA
ncbi:MAG TPA: hypothetical protein VF213_07960 [Dongiaceae bacterium]